MADTHATNWLSIQSTAAEVGFEIWIAEQLFLGFGNVSAHEVEPSLKVVSGSWSRNYGESSQRWREVLPLLREPSSETFVTSPSAQISGLLEEAFSLPEMPDLNDQANAAGMLSVVVASVANHQDWLKSKLSKVADSPVIRQCQWAESETARCVIQLDSTLKALLALGANSTNCESRRDEFSGRWSHAMEEHWSPQQGS